MNLNLFIHVSRKDCQNYEKVALIMQQIPSCPINSLPRTIYILELYITSCVNLTLLFLLMKKNAQNYLIIIQNI